METEQKNQFQDQARPAENFQQQNESAGVQQPSGDSGVRKESAPGPKGEKGGKGWIVAAIAIVVIIAAIVVYYGFK